MDEKDCAIESLADQERTTDPSVIYDDLDELPDWWRNGVEEFKAHGLRPYRPSRFSDGEIVRVILEQLENKYDISIEIKAKNPNYNGKWGVFINGEKIMEIDHKRQAEGYTQYKITSKEIEMSIKSAMKNEDMDI